MNDSEKLQKKILELSIEGPVSAIYNHPQGISTNHSIAITVGAYTMVMEYFLPKEGLMDQIITRMYFNDSSRQKHQFMIQKEDVLAQYPNLFRAYKDFHVLRTTSDSWLRVMENVLDRVVARPHDFVKMCNKSCPFNPNGSNKHDQWYTTAEIKIVMLTSVFGKNNYKLKCSLKRLAYEKPIPYVIYIDVNDFFAIHSDVDKNDLNEMMPNDLKVITCDMMTEPQMRKFYPYDYNRSWDEFLNSLLHDYTSQSSL